MSAAAADTTLVAPRDEEIEAARRQLIVYAVALAVVAAITLVIATFVYPISPAIAVDANAADPARAVALGVVFWILLGFAGSIRTQGIAGGGVVTFHMPFVVAATILGGPVVGAWMGVISQTEIREIRRVPWYGTLANHAVCVLSAVAAGLIGQLVGLAFGGVHAGPDALVTLAIALGVAVSFVAVNVALVVPVAALRSGSSLASVLRTYSITLRATIVAELALAWLMAVTYLAVAWWAPIFCVLVVIAVWDAHDRREAMRRDPMTGLLNTIGMTPLLEAAVDEARVEGRRHALLFIDLDGFGQLNKAYGEEAADDLLKAVAGRLASAVRSSDVVGRQHRAGDEFVVLFRDVPDDETAVRLAWRLHERIGQPVRNRGSETILSVGASIGVAMLEPGTDRSLADLSKIADLRMQAAKRARAGVNATLGHCDAPEPRPAAT